MKPNRTNSFRLQRISRASSLKKHSQTFYNADESFKLAAINSVSRGIKYNDPTFLIGDNLHKLRKEPLDEKDAMYEVSHQGLADVRKKYDDMKKQRVKVDEAIYRLKEDIRKYQIFQTQYNDKISEARNKVQLTVTSLEDKKKLLEATVFEKKVLQNMAHQIKSDKVTIDQRKFDLNKELAFLQKQLSVLKKDGMNVLENGDRATKIQKAFMKEISEEQQERQKHIANLEEMIDQKHAMNQHNVTRGFQINQIAVRAMQDKDPNEKQWYNIYMNHLFVSKILRDKIDREMMKFSTVELAFKTIKTATGINNTDTLIYKYLNKEAVYGDLLGRITANEQRITELKEQQEDLIKEERQLEMERQTIQNIKLKSTDFTHQLNNLEVIEALRTKIQGSKSTLGIWLVKQFRKFSLIDSVRSEEYKYDKGLTLHENFIIFLKKVSQLVDSCEKDQDEEVTDAGDLTGRDSARVTRVLLKNQSKNSVGGDDQDQQKLPKNANEEENDVLDMQRGNILVNNDKFMKEARKRRDEWRKLLVEKDKGKQKERKPEVKKDDDE